MTGYSPEEFHKNWRLVREIIHPEDLPQIDQYLSSAEEPLPLVTARLIHKNGEVVWVEQHATLLRDETGKPVAVEANVRDVTERVRIEANLERFRTEFLVVLAHEFRTPLTAIKGSAAIGLSPDEPPKPREARELFKIIDEQADHLREVISNLLDVTQIETGLMTLNMQEASVCMVLNEAIAEFAKSGTTHKVTLELPGAAALAESGQTSHSASSEQLLLNAAHVSSATETIVLSATAEEGAVRVQVRDNGRGIPPDKLPHLFLKFHKVDEIADRGAGLGLAISRGIVEAHGGRIWAESAGKGSGATFSFTLPAGAADAEAGDYCA